MKTCDYCETAQTKPDFPLYRAMCRGCGIRALATGPEFYASGVDGSLSVGYRKALALIGGDAWREVHAEVKAEAARIKAARAAA